MTPPTTQTRNFGDDGSLPKQFWAIHIPTRTITTGNSVGMTAAKLAEMTKNYGPEAEVTFSDTRPAPKSKPGPIFGYTWEQIDAMQQKRNHRE